MQDRNGENSQKFLLLTAKDVSESLQISEAKAYMLMQRGKIATVKIGRIVRVRPSDLDSFIQGSMSA
jgi:excisionase family DNA binding protein